MNLRFISNSRHITSFSTLSKKTIRLKRQQLSPAKPPSGEKPREKVALLETYKPCSKRLLDISFCSECEVCPTLNPRQVNCHCAKNDQPFLCKKAITTVAFYHWRVSGKKEKLGKFLRDWMSRGITSKSDDFVFVHEYGFEIPREIGMEGDRDRFLQQLSSYLSTRPDLTDNLSDLTDSEPEIEDEPPRQEFDPNNWASMTDDQWKEFFKWDDSQLQLAKMYRGPSIIINAYFNKMKGRSFEMFPDPVVPLSTAAAMGFWRDKVAGRLNVLTKSKPNMASVFLQKQNVSKS